jgi:hypothetical protein
MEEQDGLGQLDDKEGGVGDGEPAEGGEEERMCHFRLEEVAEPNNHKQENAEDVEEEEEEGELEEEMDPGPFEEYEQLKYGMLEKTQLPWWCHI